MSRDTATSSPSSSRADPTACSHSTWPPSIPCSIAWKSETGSPGAGSRKTANGAGATTPSRPPVSRFSRHSERAGRSSLAQSPTCLGCAMHDWRAEIRTRLANAHIDPANEAEIVEELAQHLDDEFAELRALGHDVPAARRTLLAQLDEPDFSHALLNRERARQRTAPASIGATPSVGGWVASVWQDVRYGSRALSRSPVF